LAVIGFAMLVLTLVEYRRRRFRLGVLFLWLLPWLLLVLGSIYPPLVWFILEVMSLGLPIHIATVLSIAILFSISYILYIRVVDLERKLRILVQRQALEELEELVASPLWKASSESEDSPRRGET